MSTIRACTIVARNYLPAARVLARSFNEHHPEGRFMTLVVDDVYGVVDPGEEPFEVIGLDDIGIEHDEARRMAAIYDVTELCTALKPWLLETLLAEGADAAIYLDPDIKVYAPLDQVAELAAEHGIVLTPHVNRPLPRDGQSKSESEILESGIYNLGFIALSDRCGDLLSFWKERLRRDCVVDPTAMRFVDQRWIDFVPGIYPVHILRDPTYNVAYWNLDHREVTFDGQRYLVDGLPLHFFHFSGYSPNAPYLLSKHQGERPRILLSEHPDLARICGEYGTDLLAAGYGESGGSEYGFKRLANGVVFDVFMRRVYRSALLEAEENGTELPPNPLEGDEDGAFVEWLNEPPEDRPGSRLSRYLWAVHDGRVDLQRAFSDPDGEDFSHFAGWAHHEVSVGRLDRRFAVMPIPGTPEARALDLPPEETVLRPGIRVAGYLRAETGVGEHARLAVAAAERAGIATSTYVDTTSVSRQDHPFDASGPSDLDVNLVCVNADELPRFARRVGSGFFQDRYTIGLWAWELEEFPARFASAFEHVDEIWANSEFTRLAIAQISPKPVYAFPLPIADPLPVRQLSRAELGIPESFVFLFCFDLMSITERKNPLGLIEAFTKAFEPGEGPMLVVKAVNSERKRVDLERLKWAAAQRPDVIVLDRYLDAESNRALMATCDCYVSLHRSEGFGLTLAEAMALGKPVIATGYSGNLDFMTPETSYLVPWTPGEVPVGCEPYPPGTRWSEPDLEAAGELMRAVYAHPEEAAEVGRRAREHVLANHGVDARARFVAERFAAAQEELAKRPASGESRGASATPPLIALAQGSPPVDAPSRHPRAARFLRRLVRRTLRHHDAYQREVNLQLAMGVEHLARLLTELQSVVFAPAQPTEHAQQFTEDVRRFQDALSAQGRRLRQGDRRVSELSDAVDQVVAAVQDLRATGVRLADPERLERIELAVDTAAELQSLPFMADPEQLLVVNDEGRPAIGYRDRGERGQGYASFEDVFRGSESMIRERMRAYLPLLSDHTPVVEIGSGRGELLDLLAEEGIPALGVDVDASMVRRAKERGHDVLERDGVDYLAERPTGSIGAVFAAQVVEHLPPEQLFRLLLEAKRALRRDGVLVLETVNPYSIRAFRSFWTDVTHRAPIFPEALVVYCRDAGFEEALIVFPQGTGDLERDRWSTGEYAVVAHGQASGR